MNLTRRKLLTGGAALAAAAALPPMATAAPEPATLRVVKRSIDVDGRGASVFGIVQPDGKHGLDIDVTAPFQVRLENQSGEDTLVHWHGLTPPASQDGVPGLSQPLLAPGAAYDYDFPLQRPGTFWMHSHYGLQEQRLLAAPLIVRDSAGMPKDEQEIVIMLHDFTFRNPEEIFAELTGGMAMMDHSAMAQGSRMDMGQGGMAGMDHSAMGHGAMPSGMGHLNDVEYDAYLANDRTLDDPEIVTVGPRSKVLLRFINGSASTNFWIDLGELEGSLVAVDGSPCRRSEIDGEGKVLRGRRFPLAMSQRIDVAVPIQTAGAFPILALREGDMAQTGIILATPGAAITRVPIKAADLAPPVDLGLERAIAAVHPIARAADRRLTLDLTGAMMGYVWGLNGLIYGAHRPLTVTRGQRVEIEMVNRTDMSHPMHLHGHTFQVVEIDGQRIDGPMRDTVLVPVSGRVAIAFDADNPGRWAFHCHNLYHMAAGMMTTLEYET
ncbi:MAG: multicopper oxidase family protein [Dongiaceae bacterium]